MRKIYINRIEELEKILRYGNVEQENLISNYDGNLMTLLVNDDNSMSIVFNRSKAFYRVLEIASERILFGVEQLIVILGNYIPIYDTNNNILFSKKDYDLFRSKMQGLSHYGFNNYAFSNNLDFNGIEAITSEIVDSIQDSSKKCNSIINVLKSELSKIGVTVGFGSESNVDVYLIDTGSTGRGTNIPYDADFDFIARINPNIFNDPDKLMKVKMTMLNVLGGDIYSNLLHDQIRGVSCKMSEYSKPLSVDITFTSSEKVMEYTTELAIIDRLETMKKENYDNYLKVIANIIMAKRLLKAYGAYKPSRSDRNQAGLGGVGLENLIIQNGGSFYDAALEFLSYAEGKTFIEFEKNYPLFDFGKNHVSVEKRQFPYDNFIMKNMREDGFRKMCECLKQYVKSVDGEKENGRER